VIRAASVTTTRRRQGVRGAVQAAVAAVHASRPTTGAPAGAHALWWHQQASVLQLLADQEADSERAAAAKADADLARRLARGMAEAHAGQAAEPPSLDAVVELDTASGAEIAEVGW
jgi:hypothetical protein